MKKVVGDTRLIYKVCKLYYEDGLSQQDIADRIGVSRVSISRMLVAGRENGTVRIQIISPNNLTYNNLEKDLELKFGLKEAIIVEDSPLETQYDFITSLGVETMRVLESYLHDGDVVGIAMGNTLKSICSVPRQSVKNINCTFIPLLGGMHVSSLFDDIHSNDIAKRFAEKFGAEYTEFLAPAVFLNKDVLEGFKLEMPMQAVIKKFKKMSTAIFSVGYSPKIGELMVKAGYMTKEQEKHWTKLGAVGDISLQLFDNEGNYSPFSEHNERVSGMGLGDLKNIKNKIAVSCGANKAEAINAAIKGGLINILITDQKCAKELLKIS